MENSYAQRISVAENRAARSIEAKAFWEPGSTPVLTIDDGLVERTERASIPNESNGVLKMAFSYKDGKVFFMGVADTESFELTYGSIMKALDMLSDAVNFTKVLAFPTSTMAVWPNPFTSAVTLYDPLFWVYVNSKLHSPLTSSFVEVY